MAEKRRGLIIDDLIGITDDGYVVHVPSGRCLLHPVTEEGLTHVVTNDRAWVEHFLAADPEAWEESRETPWDTPIRGKLKTRLKRAVNSYRGA